MEEGSEPQPASRLGGPGAEEENEAADSKEIPNQNQQVRLGAVHFQMAKTFLMSEMKRILSGEKS